MSEATQNIYLELAEAYEERGQAAMRDRFLVLAADAAFMDGQPEEAEKLRQRLLQGNPHHMLKPYSSYEDALEAPAIHIYVQDLRTNYPLEMAQKLLDSLRKDGPEKDESPRKTDIPPTAPFLNPDGLPTVPLGGNNDSLQLFGLHEEAEPPPPTVPLRPTSLHPPRRVPDIGRAPPTAPLPRVPRPAAARPKTPAPKAPAAPPPTAPPPPPPALLPRTMTPGDRFAPTTAPEPAEPELPAGAWLTLLLFGMTLTAGVALGAYTLARPFLPPEWLP